MEPHILKMCLLCIILASECFTSVVSNAFISARSPLFGFTDSPQAIHILLAVFSVPSFPLMPSLKSPIHPFYLERTISVPTLLYYTVC